AHRVGRAQRIVATKTFSEFTPSPGILVLKLDAGGTFRISRREGRGAPCFEIRSDCFGNTAEVVLVRLFRTIAGACRDNRNNARGIANGGVETGKATHRKAHNM